jgi:carboxypeptidase PM20D1
MERMRGIIADERVELSIHGLATEAVAANPEHERLEGPLMQEMLDAVAEVFPDPIPAPFVFTATTDSRHYQGITKGIFRFNPFRQSTAELAGMHGHNERISVANLEAGRDFYSALLRRL